MQQDVLDEVTRVIRQVREVLSACEPQLTEQERAAVLGAIVTGALSGRTLPSGAGVAAAVQASHVETGKEGRAAAPALNSYEPDVDPNPHRLPRNVMNSALWVLYIGARRARPFKAPSSFISQFLTDQAGLPTTPEAVDMALKRALRATRHDPYVFRQRVSRRWHWQITAAGEKYLEDVFTGKPTVVTPRD
jgi:hypothetical protein